MPIRPLAGAKACHAHGVEIIPFAARPTAIAGLYVIQMKQVTDERGTVREFYRQSEFVAAGLPAPESWTQLNLTATRRGALRGLHGEATMKFVSVAHGSAFGAYLDARDGSATFGTVETVELVPGTGVLVSPGICNGFQATGEGMTEYGYCFDREWTPEMAGVAVNPFDPELAIPWPIAIDRDDRSLVSAKDAALPGIAALR